MSYRNKPTGKPKYLDPLKSTHERVNDLLTRMTLEEKIAQMDLIVLANLADFLGVPRTDVMTKLKQVGMSDEIIVILNNVFCHSLIMDDGSFSETVALEALGKIPPGAAWGVLPSTHYSKAVAVINRLQKMTIEKHRLSIPLLIAEEGLHGLMTQGATVFPQAIGLASTWNPELIKDIGKAIGAEARSTGANLIFAPVLDVSRDPRWGRTEETFGEDPYLVSKIGEGFVIGLQEKQGETVNGPAATIKHFGGHGHTISGRDSNVDNISERELREIHFPPFLAAVKAGARAVMSAYHSLSGIPCTANEWLLTNILRSEWGFDGFIVTDAGAIDDLHRKYHVVANQKEAIQTAIHAGVDCHNNGPDFRDPLRELILSGELSENVVDASVRRILSIKFQLGLFDKPYVDSEKTIADIQSNKNLAYEAARQSIVLLKNHGNLLPLNKDISAILVTGPNSDNALNQVGDYSGRTEVITILDGIRNKLSPRTKLYHMEGCGIRSDSSENIESVVDTSKKVDVAVIVLGGSSSYGIEATCGEGRDRVDLRLPGRQSELVERVSATGTPVVVVLINGRPLTIEWISQNVPVIMEAWYPGQAGGSAIADILFGDANPGGKLPITFPQDIGQLPLYYNQKPSGREIGYIDGTDEPLFEFGYGLSYTKFEYSNLEISPIKVDSEESVIIHVDIKNVGDFTGDEVIQLYIRDCISSVVTPKKALKAFRRISLQPGEMKQVSFELEMDTFSLWNKNMEWVVEPGIFEIMLGSSSEDIRMKSNLEIINNEAQ